MVTTRSVLKDHRRYAREDSAHSPGLRQVRKRATQTARALGRPQRIGRGGEKTKKKTPPESVAPENRKKTHVGDIVRRLRKSRHLSVRTLADKCGFSPSFISQVELRQASPSIASTERIASALGVTLGEFFRTTSSSHAAVIRADARPVVESEWSRARIEAIGPISEDSQLEPMVITLESGGASGSRPYVRRAEQLAVVLQGTVELTLEENTYNLKRGDAACIPSDIHHCWRNTSRKPAQVLIVTAHRHL